MDGCDETRAAGVGGAQAGPGHVRMGGGLVTRGRLHHVELWVPDLARATASIGWLLEVLGYCAFQSWAAGRSWQLGETYIVIEQSPALTGRSHDRHLPGLNHLAFHAGSPAEVDALVADAAGHGWTLLFPEAHPHAGGPGQYAGYLANADGFEVELVADTEPAERA